MNIGYACINMQLSYPQKYGGQEKGVLPITTGRSMIRRTLIVRELFTRPKRHLVIVVI